MNILVSGSLAYDRIMNFNGRFADHILPEKIHALNVSFHVHTFKESFGGTAGNIAYNLALLREKPVILGSYGNDFKAYKSWLKKRGVEVSYARSVKKTPSASAYIITDKSDNQIAGFFPGAMQFPNGPVPKKFLNGKSLGIVSPGNLTDMKRYPAVYRKARTPYIYDPGQQIPVLSKNDILAGLKGAKALISNYYELDLIFKKTGLTLKKLLSMTEIVVTTKGEKGSVIFTGSKKIKIPPGKPKNDSDPTGAGDAYRAGFIRGLIMGYPLPKVGRLAAVVSVYTVEKYGTQTHSFTWSDIQKRYYRNFGERL